MFFYIWALLPLQWINIPYLLHRSRYRSPNNTSSMTNIKIPFHNAFSCGQDILNHLNGKPMMGCLETPSETSWIRYILVISAKWCHHLEPRSNSSVRKNANINSSIPEIDFKHGVSDICLKWNAHLTNSRFFYFIWNIILLYVTAILIFWGYKQHLYNVWNYKHDQEIV